MITQIGNRQSTRDIDVVIATGDAKTYQAVQLAIQQVAAEKKLPSAWLNDDVTLVVDQIGKPQRPTYWKTFAGLTVYVPEFAYVLALKLFSGRPQDDRDIQALAQRIGVRTQTQAWSIVHAYIPDAQLNMRRRQTAQAVERSFLP